MIKLTGERIFSAYYLGWSNVLQNSNEFLKIIPINDPDYNQLMIYYYLGKETKNRQKDKQEILQLT